MGIITVKLSQLRLSPLNQRRVKPSAIESMADDIAAHGLLQNLVAYEDEGLFYVFAGGRRYRGLKELAKRKQIKNSDGFPVEVRTKEEAIELSLAENFQREDMHPADSIRAFAALRDTGMDAEEIAARFGQAVSFVYKMLRLSALAPALIDLIAKDQLSLEAARALTLTDDHDQQVKVCKAANGHAHTIRRMLTTEKVDTTSGAFIFVGRDAYEAKGGTITVDLFSQGAEGFADQPELVQELAEDKLDTIADEYRAIGWHEVRATLDRPYDLYMKGSLYPATREPTEDEAARIEAIDAAIEQIAEAEGEDSDRIAALSDERDAITEGLRGFNAEQVAVGGVALWVSHDGSLGKSFYRAKAEPKPKAGSGEPQPLYSNSLVADLSRIKTRIVQEAVAADPALALDMLLDSLAGQLLHGAHSYQMAIDVQAKTIATDVADDLMATSDVREVEETMADRFASIPAEGRFEVIRAMSHDDKMVLLAGLVAMTVDGTLFAGGAPGARHHHFEQVARASGVDIASRWQAPIALFDKMRRAALIDLLRAECGDASADNCATIKKKADLAVNVSGRLAAHWLPAPMQIGAFDQPERDELDDPEADAFDGEGGESEDMEADEMV
ncbi:ParB/RepB/Spo0J family partition protein [Sphingomonas paucimobilis]|jgi:ParB family chromosome partitioning protein|uniref:ParB/RepB/Spo0J family partition protein n=2 Tax=Bacteria TaxID=2 RepID=UPI0031D2A6C7